MMSPRKSPLKFSGLRLSPKEKTVPPMSTLDETAPFEKALLSPPLLIDMEGAPRVAHSPCRLCPYAPSCTPAPHALHSSPERVALRAYMACLIRPLRLCTAFVCVRAAH